MLRIQQYDQHQPILFTAGQDDLDFVTYINDFAAGEEHSDEDEWQHGSYQTQDVCNNLAFQTTSPEQKNAMIAAPGHILADPYGILSGEGNDTVHHVGQWYFYQQLDDSLSHCYTPAVQNWVDIIWDMARDHNVMFNAIIAMALHKKSALSNSLANRQYLLSKNRMLRQTAERIPTLRKCRDNRLAVAISLLAYFDIRDGDFDAAETPQGRANFVGSRDVECARVALLFLDRSSFRTVSRHEPHSTVLCGPSIPRRSESGSATSSYCAQAGTISFSTCSENKPGVYRCLVSDLPHPS